MSEVIPIAMRKSLMYGNKEEKIWNYIDVR
jgi:hypothetical protein